MLGRAGSLSAAERGGRSSKLRHRPAPDNSGDATSITVAVSQSDIQPPETADSQQNNAKSGEAARRLLQIIDSIRERSGRRDPRLLVAIQVYRNEEVR